MTGHNIGIIVVDGSSCIFGILKEDCYAKCIDKVIHHSIIHSARTTTEQKRERRLKRQRQYLSDCLNKLKWVYQGNNTISMLFVAGLGDYKDIYISMISKIEPIYYQIIGGVIDVQYGSYNGLYQAEQLIRKGQFRKPPPL